MPKYIDSSDLNTIINKLKSAGVASSLGLPAFQEKIQDYTWYFRYDNLDYTLINQSIAGGFKSTLACTSVWRNGILGRNFDWNYSHNIEAIVVTPQNLGKYGSVSVCTCIGAITEEDMQKGTANQKDLKLLPFHVTDGINSQGVACSMNVVPALGNPDVQPEIEVRHTINSRALLRYVLDNFASATDAVNNIKNYVKIIFDDDFIKIGFELHYLITDITKAYIIEIVDNKIQVLDVSTSNAVIANFHNYGVTFNDDGTVETPETGKAHAKNNVDLHGSGLERYNSIVNAYSTITDTDSMYSALSNILFSQCYQPNIIRYSEFVGDTPYYGDITVDSDVKLFKKFKSIADQRYIEEETDDNRRNIGDLWWSSHSSVYDIANRQLIYRANEDPMIVYTFQIPEMYR